MNEYLLPLLFCVTSVEVIIHSRKGLLHSPVHKSPLHTAGSGLKATHYFYSCFKQGKNDKATPLTPQQCKETTIALTSHTNILLIKRQKTGEANDEMNGEMKKNSYKGVVVGVEGVRYHWTILNLLFALSSLSLVINDFRFDASSPQPYNKTHFLLFKQWRKKRFFVRERQGVYIALLPSSRKAGGSRRGSQPGPTLESPHKSWFEQGANQRR